MAEREEQLRDLAAAIIEECGEDADHWVQLRVAHCRNEGDHTRAQFWEEVGALVLKIQRGLARRYH